MLAGAALLLASACSRGGPHGATGRLRFEKPGSVSLDAEAKVLGGPEIAARVVQHRDLANDPAYGGSFAAATQKIAGLLAARPVAPDSLEITVEGKDAKQAVDLCNVALGAYLEQRLQHQRMTSVGRDAQLSHDARIVQVCKYH